MSVLDWARPGRLTGLSGPNGIGRPNGLDEASSLGESSARIELSLRGGRRAVRDALVVGGLLVSMYLFVLSPLLRGSLGYDAFAYWAVHIDNPYFLQHGAFGAFVYTPVAARLLALGGLLSWPAFWLLWTAILVATVVWLGWRSSVILLAFPPVIAALWYGNIDLLIAAAIALGFRYPAAWSFVLLTKVSPGVGLIWFVVRREWRSLIIAIVVTDALIGVSLLIDPTLWQHWLSDIVAVGPGMDGVLAIPVVIRFGAAAVLVAWGAATNRRWTVPLGAMLALPVIWFQSLSMLAAVAAVNRPQLGGPQVRATQPGTLP